ncbi:MAG: hypothetical protein IKI64_11120 [Clostridia bacterium]|nr:hypothetical protein [Clostridia bacterium]
MYSGKDGFIYTPISTETLKNTRGNSWESASDVPVFLLEHVKDVYVEILKEEAAGRVIIHRYDEIDRAEQKEHANYFRDHLNDPVFAEYREFIYRHFSTLWD